MQKGGEKKSLKKEEWKGLKYALLKNAEDLTEEMQKTLEKVFSINPVLKVCYELKESFRKIFNESMNKREAKSRLHEWILKVLREDVCQY